jgi:hypothetical protein
MLRKIHRFGKFSALLLLFSFTCSTLAQSSVNAASDYDDVVHVTQDVKLKRSNYEMSVTQSYLNLVLDCARWTSHGSVYSLNCGSFTSKLNNALDNESGIFVAERTAKVAFSIGDQNLEIGDKYIALGVNDASDNYGLFTSAENTRGLFLRGSNTTCAAYLTLNSQNSPVVATVPCTSGNTEASQASVQDDYWLWTSRSLLVNSSIDYPTAYEGNLTQSIDISELDIDNDDLNRSQELAQGTSDTNQDTDGDGLSDLIESQWYSSRNSVFCGSECAYPNPTQKDLYVEIDWMKEPGTNGRSFKPNSTQINSVRNAYAAKDIIAHFDTSQYGGGNELPSYTQSLRFVPDTGHIDFYDYKNGSGSIAANFSPSRNKIWHYLISGYKYYEFPDSSGASYTSDDDSFISTGLIKDGQSTFGYLDFDTALSGSIIHELGHSLCLSPTQDYSNHPQQCIYSGIDSSNSAITYVSSMNYSYQMFMVNYSSGQNNPDHDDWAAVSVGINDFADPNRDAGDSLSHGKKQKDKITRKGISISQAQELRKKGKLGHKNNNFFTRNQYY